MLYDFLKFFFLTQSIKIKYEISYKTFLSSYCYLSFTRKIQNTKILYINEKKICRNENNTNVVVLNKENVFFIIEVSSTITILLKHNQYHSIIFNKTILYFSTLITNNSLKIFIPSSLLTYIFQLNCFYFILNDRIKYSFF